MHARVLVALVLVAGTAEARRPPPPHVEPPPPPPDQGAAVFDSETSLHAALAPNGDEVRLVTVIGGKSAGARLQVGKSAARELAKGDAVGTIETAHGIVVTALAITDAKQPFRIYVGDEAKPTKIARPGKRYDLPFAIALTPTPDGFTAFFQEIEAQNTNEAHTYMQKLDKTGALVGELHEVQVPWWLADAVWNGHGYHMALFYSGEQMGMRLSMVSTDENGQPQGHPDWSSPPGGLSDVHLVASGDKLLAYYRNLDRLTVTDVTKIGQWGGNPKAGRDLGALANDAAIAINAKGQAVSVRATRR